MYSSLDFFFLKEIMKGNFRQRPSPHTASSKASLSSLILHSTFGTIYYEHLSWKSHHRQAAKILALLNIIRRKIIAVMYATFAVAKRKPEKKKKKKNPAYTGFEPLTSEIPAQRSLANNWKTCVYNCDHLPPNNSSLRSSHIWFLYIYNFSIKYLYVHCFDKGSHGL